MKKIIFAILAVAALCLIAAACEFVGLRATLSVSKNPDRFDAVTGRIEFALGEALEDEDGGNLLSGGKLLYTSNRKTTREIDMTSSEIAVTGYNKSLLGEQQINLACDKAFCTLTVYVTEAELTVDAGASRRIYDQEDAAEALDLTLKYRTEIPGVPGSETIVTLTLADDGVEVERFDMTKTGEQTVTVKYRASSVMFGVVVCARSVDDWQDFEDEFDPIVPAALAGNPIKREAEYIWIKNTGTPYGGINRVYEIREKIEDGVDAQSNPCEIHTNKRYYSDGAEVLGAFLITTSDVTLDGFAINSAGMYDAAGVDAAIEVFFDNDHLENIRIQNNEITCEYIGIKVYGALQMVKIANESIPAETVITDVEEPDEPEVTDLLVYKYKSAGGSARVMIFGNAICYDAAAGGSIIAFDPDDIEPCGILIGGGLLGRGMWDGDLVRVLTVYGDPESVNINMSGNIVTGFMTGYGVYLFTNGSARIDGEYLELVSENAADVIDALSGQVYDNDVDVYIRIA
ncbi:MAG: bacterial Ig-like domain-containing protein [Firmicutes bacterium]|nr:bacterial Ig-like domain-containing protein [Bacillota bacterium]